MANGFLFMSVPGDFAFDRCYSCENGLPPPLRGPLQDEGRSTNGRQSAVFFSFDNCGREPSSYTVRGLTKRFGRIALLASGRAIVTL